MCATSNETAWLPTIWAGFKLGVDNCAARIKPDGLFNVVHNADWARRGQGGENVAANALLYATLTCGAKLAALSKNPVVADTYTSAAAGLKTAINKLLWDESVGAFVGP